MSNPNDARGHGGPSQHDSDGQWELWWALGQARFSALERARRECQQRRYQIAAQIAASNNRHNTGQVVMQRAALIGRIAHAMVVTTTIVIGVMVVNMVCYTSLGKITGDISLGLDDVLKMGADQRHDAGDLGKEKQPQKPRADEPLGSW